MHENIIFRNYQDKHADACLEIISKTFANSDLRIAYDYFVNDNSDRFTRYVVELNHKVVGVAGYYIPIEEDVSLSYWDEYMFKHYKDNCACWDWFAISPEHQNRGFGDKTIQVIENRARRAGKEYMFVWTEISDFYKKYGYTKVVGYNESDDKKYNCILMIKKL